MLAKLDGERVGRLLICLEDDEGEDRLTADVVLLADDRGFGDGLVIDQRRFDLSRGDPVARHVHDVVDATQQPEVAVGVALGAITGEVHARETTPVRLEVPLRIAVDAPQHGRPRPLQDEVPASTKRDRVAVRVHDVGRDAREREGR